MGYPLQRRRKPPRTRYNGVPISDLCDRRLHHQSSSRRYCPEDLRAGFHVEMGRRYYLRVLASADVQEGDDHLT